MNSHFFDLSHDLCCILNTDLHVLQLNPSWEKKFPLAKQTILDHSFIDILMDEDRSPFIKYMQDLQIQKIPQEYPLRLRTKEGVIFWFQVRCFFDADEKKIHLSLLDMTETMHLRSQLELDRSKISSPEVLSQDHSSQRHLRYLQKVLDVFPFGIFVKDVQNDFRFLLWNKYMENAVGVPARFLIGKSEFDIFPKEDAIRSRDSDFRMLHTKLGYDYCEPRTMPTGKKIWAMISKVPVFADDGTPLMIVGLAEDITHDKIQAELIQSQKQMVLHSSKMATLGEMASGIAHEINNPLAVMMGMLSILKENFEDKSIDINAAVNMMEKIENKGHRISKIIQGLRFFARDGDLDPFERKSLHGIITESLELVKSKFQHHQIEIQWKEDRFHVDLMCRPVQISQVVVNLLSNAFDAIQTSSEKWVRLEVETHSDWIHFRIIDSGKGIPESIAQKIMLPFYTTKEIGKGTGLGLSISKGIIESHGGKLELDLTCPNTCFLLKFPPLPKI
jgi:PAS domain S-box-containing protein